MLVSLAHSLTHLPAVPVRAVVGPAAALVRAKSEGESCGGVASRVEGEVGGSLALFGGCLEQARRGSSVVVCGANWVHVAHAGVVGQGTLNM